MIEVLKRGTWQPHHGIVGSRTGSVGQVTKCVIDGVTCYVRENFTKVNSFVMSSNARMALKRGGTNGATQVLELWAPMEHWDRLASIIATADKLNRRVVRNRNFTNLWAEHAINGERP